MAMPHCILEYSANVPINLLVSHILEAVHGELMKVGVFELGKIKSRAIRHDQFRVGAGGKNDAFIYLEIRMFEGRTAEQKQEIGQRALRVLEEILNSKISDLNCSMTVYIKEVSRELHFSRNTLARA